MSAILRLSLVIALSIGLSSCHSLTSGPIPLEIWCRSDDGTTLQLSDTLKGATKRSSRFKLVSGNQKITETLIVILPKVEPRNTGGRERIFYSATFASEHDPTLGSSSGSCWNEELPECAAQILKDARAIAAKMK